MSDLFELLQLLSTTLNKVVLLELENQIILSLFQTASSGIKILNRNNGEVDMNSGPTQYIQNVC